MEFAETHGTPMYPTTAPNGASVYGHNHDHGQIELGTPIEIQPYTDNAIETFQGTIDQTCDKPNVFKQSFQVLLAALIAQAIPTTLVTSELARVPYVAMMGELPIRAGLTVIIFLLISQLLSKLL